ncbi:MULTISPECIES: NADH:flavin oxidoreductase [Chryseobacterium]|uniref:2,4-dienoyl-CoA reductase-like NADH-dependent reductase (Old Yellow Enzyme family) n=1 Tax=Chryseobacterium camelliae TaxID=1265445 RepID=A0ABU0TIA2_9FLAO|nr:MULTISPECIES: NADH:flavin oxidoreductase [Chryseobacterium]MDT3409345.1 2,4-dienoyl-CoA reductase-like NADH-dependent reductase (Old Yellow Enzyme family) [Pseudacidovorax intermedius]MDQ1096791.1 2,4-dienoyl-CoA reductase-like NADH-dependent reductase (Old Yellow Enzyme family) [Chryseobacterium camelliae]MDQ1100733.1 2,4-dienoyl-CoA reductase-like NADH-dependent reductase (Old Yellow Enzyme family) [Chryseobacterium sp. SORGH_AS_1048]MDR6088072.1 2,4-dienoyl-CoA reductase-like NADH-depende
MSTELLFKPFQYKNLHLDNRIVMAPMTRAQSDNGVPTQQIAEYYSRRAAAGVGLIISEGTVINRPASKNMQNIPDFYGTEALEGWKNVIDSVHANGGKMGPQIWHVGDTRSSDDYPSVPMEKASDMTLEDIQDTIAQFAASAKSAKDLGFDCLEIHGAHGYLIDQFFWEATNTRTDEYGGKTLKERSRFAVDIVKAIRAAVGEDFTIIIRLSQWKQQDYNIKLAQTPEEMEEWLLPLKEAGVDIFHCSQRRFWEAEFEGSDLNFAGWAKKITGQPTITVGSVGLEGDFMAAFAGEGTGTADLSELIRRLERGDFDLVAVGRAILQDPEWVKKVKEGRMEELSDFSPSSMSTLY